MTKNITLFFLLLTFSTLLFAHQHTAKISLWKIKTRWLEEKNAEPHYFIRIAYPEILSKHYPASTQQINTILAQFINDTINQFKAKIPQDNADLKDFPSEMRKNDLYITQLSHLIHPDQRTIVSIRFQIEQMFSGHAHPSHRFKVFNYDLTSGKMLTLDSLFIPRSNYLDIMARYCREQLTKKVSYNMPWLPWLTKGTAPIPDNFKNWNVQTEGILITFEEYQVAPYSFSAQTVLVPYSILHSVIPEFSPIADCINKHLCT